MRTWAMTVLAASMVSGSAAAQQTLDFAGRSWVVTAPDARVEEYLGRTALRLRNGGAFLPDAAFREGSIEYDVATTGHRSFVGAALNLRQGERTTYEEFYLRPHQTGRFDALQYTPNFGGLTAWQLYPEYNAPADIPPNTWIHVRLVITGSRLEAFIGDGSEPDLVVEQLRQGEGPGGIGLYSNFPEATALALYPTAFSNFEMHPAESSTARPAPTCDRPAGVIESWALSSSVPGTPGPVLALQDDVVEELEWEAVETDQRGRINIAERRAFPEGAPSGRVYARVVIDSDAQRSARLDFGFSDRGSVFLNGRLLFTGDNTYRSRSLRYLGVMTVDNDALYLDLREGSNELVFVVTEAFGGWGLTARIADRTGLRIRAVARGG